MKKIMLMLLIILVSIAMVATFSLTGCKEETAETTEAAETTAVAEETTAAETTSGEPIKLTVWWWGEQDEPGIEEFINESVDIYQQQNPNVTIELVLQSTDALISAFQTAAQSRSGPDIQFFWAGYLTMMNVFNGYLAPVSDYWSEEDLATLSYPEEVTYQGKVWAISFYNTIAPLIYNKEIFTQAGLDPNTPPEDWSAFLDACDKIKEAGFIPLGFGNKAETANHTQWVEGPFGGQNLDGLKDYLNVSVGAGGADYKDEKYSEWWYKLEELYQSGYINDDINSLGLNEAMEDLFATGRAAMTIAPGGLIRNFNEILNNNVGIMKVPVFGTGKAAGKANVWRKNWGITDWCQNKQEAADFLKWLASAERAEAFYLACGAFPGTKNFDASIIKDDVGNALYEALNYSFDGVTNVFIPNFVDQEGMWVASQKLFSGEYTAEQAVNYVADTFVRWREEDPEGLSQFQSWAEGMK